MTHSGKRRVVLAATAAVTLLIAAAFGYDIAQRTSSPGAQIAVPAPVTGSDSPAASVHPPQFSVFDEPRPVTDIRFQDDQDHDLTLGDFRGRVLLLNIWATWCVPCRKEMPTLDRLQARLGGKDFLVMALSIDQKGVEAVRGFYHEVGVEKLPIYVDSSGKAGHSLAVPGVPTTLLIDRQGREVARKMGAAEWDSPEMISLVRRAMHAQSVSSTGRSR